MTFEHSVWIVCVHNGHTALFLDAGLAWRSFPTAEVFSWIYWAEW